MVWWRSKTSNDPKTPKIPKVALPDEHHTPISISFGSSPSEQLPSSLLLRFTPALEKRGTTPAYGSGKAYHRSRTISSPAEVKAPKPIRPHPSQGGFNPPESALDYHTGKARPPAAVPSARFLEEQLRNNPPPMRTQVDPESERLKAVARRNKNKLEIKMSKAGLEEEKERKMAIDALEARLLAISAGETVPPLSSQMDSKDLKSIKEFDDWKPVPVDRTSVRKPMAYDGTGPLKPALKKPIALKSALKNKHLAPSKGYHSESEVSVTQRGMESNRNGNLVKITTTPSKAFLEDQEEKRQEQERRKRDSTSATAQRSGFRPAPEPIPILRPPESFMVPRSRTSSSATPPVEQQYIVADPYYSVQHLQWNDAVLTPRLNSNYVGPSQFKIEPQLSWPLISYNVRYYWKLDNAPLIFDAGVNPRIIPIKTVKGRESVPLTRLEEILGVASNCFYGRMHLHCKKLHRWDIVLMAPKGLRIIDVFRAIYDCYSRPLTREEMEEYGEDYIKSCREEFLRRCREAPGVPYREESRGLLRIDLLRGKRMFDGLVPIPGRPDHYEIIFSRPIS